MTAQEVIDNLNSLADYYQNAHPITEEDQEYSIALDLAIDFIQTNEKLWTENKKKTFTFRTTVQAATLSQAQIVMAERLGHDEDYGFDYKVDYERLQ